MTFSPVIKCTFSKLISLTLFLNLPISLETRSCHSLCYLVQTQLQIHPDNKNHLVIFLLILISLRSALLTQLTRLFLAEKIFNSLLFGLILRKCLLNLIDRKPHFQKFLFYFDFYIRNGLTWFFTIHYLYNIQQSNLLKCKKIKFDQDSFFIHTENSNFNIVLEDSVSCNLFLLPSKNKFFPFCQLSLLFCQIILPLHLY